jgi:hypothetical protein
MHLFPFPPRHFFFFFSKPIWDRFAVRQIQPISVSIKNKFQILLFVTHHCSMITQKKKGKKKLTTPFNRYNSSKRFPLFELGTGVSSVLKASSSNDDDGDDIVNFFVCLFVVSYYLFYVIFSIYLIFIAREILTVRRMDGSTIDYNVEFVRTNKFCFL